MSKGYYLVGEYHETPVYFSRTQGLALGSRMDELAEPTAVQNLEILRDLGGMKGIERLVNNYDRTARLEAKKNVTRKK